LSTLENLAYRVFLGGALEPWRSLGPFSTRTAAGNHFYQRAILADLRDEVPSDVPILLTNFNPSTRREDTSVSLALSLHLAGQPPPVWYWIVDTEQAALDYRALALLDGVDLLPDVFGTGELILVIRNAEAQARLGEQLCAALPSDRRVMADYYLDWLAILHHEGNPGFNYPASPLPACLTDSDEEALRSPAPSP
jgi:hypothetical protein